jgi:hypothetical protein
MKNFYLQVILILTGTISYSQNLVPNGDFEQYSGCPTGYSQIDSALYWTVPTSVNSTDYYNACAISLSVSVPLNGAGFQETHSGSGYGGFI